MGRCLVTLVTVLVLISVPVSCALELKLSRDFGTELGGKIKGTFSVRVRETEGIERVEFYLDGEPVETVTAEPYRWRFKTTDYPDGNHTIRAVAYFESGKTDEGSMRVTFESDFGDWWTIYLWGMVLFVGGILIITVWLTNRERRKPQGKTKCPKCGTVFERKWSPMHMGEALRNTCPMCGNTFWADRIEDEDAEGSPSVL